MSSSAPIAPVRAGEIIAGKYRVDRVLGAGGMGVVVAATHLQLEQSVALKFLREEALAHPSIVERFAREARASVKIRSEHVARVHDVGVLESGAPYIVMEYLEGEDLEQSLRRRGPLPVDETVGYVLEGCEAVAEAHALGIVHRDLKPANLFLAKGPTDRPTVKVLDFGISKLPASAEGGGLTRTAALMGSPYYMSPEQLTRAHSVDVRSDVWAIGVILHELLTQRQPFIAETMPELVALILHETPEGVRTQRPDVPVGLEAAIRRCLEKDPSRRFANVADLANAIAPYGGRMGELSVERISHALGVVPASSAVLENDASIERAPTVDVVATSAPWEKSAAPAPAAVAPSGGKAKWRMIVPAAVAVVAAGAFVLATRSHEAPASVGRVSSSEPSAPTAAVRDPVPVPVPAPPVEHEPSDASTLLPTAPSTLVPTAPPVRSAAPQASRPAAPPSSRPAAPTSALPATPAATSRPAKNPFDITPL